MPAIPIIAGVAAVASVGATVASISSANKARKAQQRQNRYERQIQANRSARERIQAVRSARIASGALTQGAETRGASTTSGFLGGLGSIQSQLNSNLSFLDTQTRLSDAASVQAGRASNYNAQSQIWAGVSDVAKSVFTAAGGTDAFSKGN